MKLILKKYEHLWASYTPLAVKYQCEYPTFNLGIIYLFIYLFSFHLVTISGWMCEGACKFPIYFPCIVL